MYKYKKLSIFSSVILSFILSFIILYYTSPNWIMSYTDYPDGHDHNNCHKHYHISYLKITVWSFFISISFGILTFLFISKSTENQNIPLSEQNSSTMPLNTSSNNSNNNNYSDVYNNI